MERDGHLERHARGSRPRLRPDTADDHGCSRQDGTGSREVRACLVQGDRDGRGRRPGFGPLRAEVGRSLPDWPTTCAAPPPTRAQTPPPFGSRSRLRPPSAGRREPGRPELRNRLAHRLIPADSVQTPVQSPTRGNPRLAACFETRRAHCNPVAIRKRLETAARGHQGNPTPPAEESHGAWPSRTPLGGGTTRHERSPRRS